MMKDTDAKRHDQRLTSRTSNYPSEQEFQQISRVFREGKLIVYPTETLYALGADPFNEEALDRIFEVKRRPRDMPISIAVSDITMMNTVAYVNALARKIYKRFLPGPITLLLKKKECVPSMISGSSHKIGLRVPKHAVALKIIEDVGPITCTSANLHGHPDAKNHNIAREQLGHAVALYLDCGECEYKSASTVVDISDSSVKIIRRGVVPPKELLALVDAQS